MSDVDDKIVSELKRLGKEIVKERKIKERELDRKIEKLSKIK